MSWRLAKSLETLRAQINAAAPGRSKLSDGTIGDAAHSARTSDHNPDSDGVVKAFDITHDPRAGVDCNAIAEALKRSGDKRIKYLIWNSRIWNPSIAGEWRAYTGGNPHNKHLHVSVQPGRALYDDASPWQWGAAAPAPNAPAVPVRPVLKAGVKGADAHITTAKTALLTALQNETGFGPMLDGLVRGFQVARGLTPDGRIGPYTWDQLRN